MAIAVVSFYIYRTHFFARFHSAFPDEFANITRFSIEGYPAHIRYLDFITLTVLLLASASLIFALVGLAVRTAPRFRALIVSWPVLASAAVLSMFLAYAFTYFDTLKNVLFATHESEWLDYTVSPCSKFIHGWLVNCFPAQLWGLAPAGGQIMFGRLVRFFLGSIPYLLAPLVLYLALKADLWPSRRNKAEGAPAGSKKAAFIAACIAIVLLPASYLSFGSMELSFPAIPVRDISLSIILIGGLSVIAVQNAALPASRMVYAWAFFGICSALSFFANILAPAQAMVILAAPLYQLLVSQEHRRLRSLLYPAIFALACLLTLLLAWLIAPQATKGSIDSFLYFSKYGAYIFADQYVPRATPPTPRTYIAMMTLATCTICILHSLFSKARLEAGLLALTLGNLTNIFLVTGLVTSTGGALLSLAYLLGRLVWDFFPSMAERSPRAARENGNGLWLFLALALSLGTISAGRAYNLAGSIRSFWHNADSSYLGTETQAYIASRDGGAGCYFSLLSENSLAVLSRVRLCSRYGMPWYNAGISGQTAIIGELESTQPRMVHVASAHPDNTASPERHLYRIARWVYAHYCPDRLIGGRWFWSRKASSCNIPDGSNALAADQIAMDSYGPLTIAVPGPDGAAGDAGVIVTDLAGGEVLAAAIASKGAAGPEGAGAGLQFSLSATPDMTNRQLGLFLVEPGGAIRQVRTIVLKDNRGQ